MMMLSNLSRYIIGIACISFNIALVRGLETCNLRKRNEIMFCRSKFSKKGLNPALSIFNREVMREHCKLVDQLKQCGARYPECSANPDHHFLDKPRTPPDTVNEVFKVLCDQTFLDEHFPCIMEKMRADDVCKWNASDPRHNDPSTGQSGKIDERTFCSALNFYLSCIEPPVEKHCGKIASIAITNVLFYSAKFVPNCTVQRKQAPPQYLISGASAPEPFWSIFSNILEYLYSKSSLGNILPAQAKYELSNYGAVPSYLQGSITLCELNLVSLSGIIILVGYFTKILTVI